MRVILALSALAVAYSQATCSSYCTAYFAACSDAANNVYSGADSAAMTASCMAECAFFPATGDDAIANSSNTGNTLGCREYHAVAAAAGTTEAATHCPHARPDSTFCKSQAAADLGLGSGTCDNFCDNLKMTCGSTLLGANRDACMRSCARYRDQPTPSGMFPLAAATGDLSCRRYHVQVARTDAASATTHCPHADLLGGNGVCGAGAFNFCQQATGACMNNQTGYTDAAGCAAIWPNIPAGAAADMSGDTQFCRAYHLSVALQSAATATTHCPHTGQAGAAAGTTGAATCGDACDAYCSQYASVCANITAAAKYADTAACRTACTAFAATGMTGSTTNANTLQCRLYHLGVAATGGAATATHCPHAAQNGGGAGGPCAGGAAPTPAGGSSASSTAVSALALAVPVLAFLRV